MTRDELVELMARAIERECHKADVATGGDGFSYDRVASAALTELEKHAVVVPAEPTEAMVHEGKWSVHQVYADDRIDTIYRAMLAARPR